MNELSEKNLSDSMTRRRIALPDGRYLIFYDFAESSAESRQNEAKPEPHTQMEATEEKNV